MKSEEVVMLKKRDLIGILRDLNTIVVSIDRIGSSAPEISQESNERLLLDFLDQWNVWGKLAEIRAKLSEPFSSELGKDGMDELEREMQNVPYWSLKRRKPVRKRARS
jgi:hypothetical protein